MTTTSMKPGRWPAPDGRSASSRRSILAGSACLLAANLLDARPAAAAGDYAEFLARIRARALAAGIGSATLDQALRLERPNPKIIALDRHQPEFTLTWSEYKARVLPESRLERGRENYAAQRSLFTAVQSRFSVGPGVIIGIWGLESDFGTKRGTYGTFDSLATLSYDGRRAAFFENELMDALRIADRRGIPPGEMLGSYAGAMGQPQFMPSAYLRFARGFNGDGSADIWTSEPDVFASIASYLAGSGWRLGEPWGQQVTLTRPIDPAETGRGVVRSLGAWEALGVRRLDGARFSRTDPTGALLLPDGAGGDAFLVYPNFSAIRRYNPSDFYALAVGLLGNAAT